MLGRQQLFLDLEDTELEDSDDLADIMSNVLINKNFLALAREVRMVAQAFNYQCIGVRCLIHCVFTYFLL